MYVSQPGYPVIWKFGYRHYRPGDVAVHVGGGGAEQNLQASLQILVLFARVDRVAEQLFEVLERELVHGVNVAHVGDDEVQSRTAHRHHAIAFPRDRDHLLGGFGLLQTLRDHRRRHLRSKKRAPKMRR